VETAAEIEGHAVGGQVVVEAVGVIAEAEVVTVAAATGVSGTKAKST